MIPFEQNFVGELVKSLSLFRPETTLVITFVAAILSDLIFRKTKQISAYIALIGFIVTGYYLICQTGINMEAFSRSIAIDPFSTFFKFIVLISSFIIVIISFLFDELNKGERKVGEYYSLIVGMTFGMFLLPSATNLIVIYLAIETMSLSSYVLTGYTKEVKRSTEASLKYVIFGAISSGIMIYGISILFGLTGSLNLYDINLAVAGGKLNNIALLVSGLMIISGFAYKISAVPFHFWTPDVYEGAPITITAYLSVASKAAGFAVLIRFLRITYADTAIADSHIWSMVSSVDWKLVIAILSVLTMTLGNLVAVWQTNMKRLLAYSSIAHAGYLLMGVVVMNDIGVVAILVYFFIYMLMNLGAFYIVMLYANKIGSEEIDDYVGIGYRAPTLGVCMVIFLMSLTGVPPTAGFIGKWYLFMAVLNSEFIWLAVIGVLNSVVSLFYYVKVFRNMFVKGLDNANEPINYSAPAILIAVLFAIPNILFGLYYTPIVNWAQNSVMMFLGK
ncbi:MAG: NADH-quinone oxidoreductase subunit [Bacteroidota bacterium]|nr:NADH-quinone oxidoreductase subunit [Bacteroidota bacterium]